MKRSGAPGIVFIVIGVVFIAIGSSGRPPLAGVGAAFAVIGVAMLMRQRREGGLK